MHTDFNHSSTFKLLYICSGAPEKHDDKGMRNEWVLDSEGHFQKAVNIDSLESPYAINC